MPDLPRIFISATTRDLRKERRQVMEIVVQHGRHPVVQEGFEGQPNSITVREMLERKLQPCHGVIYLCGFFYGAEPSAFRPGEVRRSYTQMEFHSAQEQKKAILVALADDGGRTSRKKGVDHHRALQAIHRTRASRLVGGERELRGSPQSARTG